MKEQTDNGTPHDAGELLIGRISHEQDMRELQELEKLLELETEAEQQEELEATYEAREKEYRRAVHYLERREQRAGGPVNPYDHNEKQFIWIDDNGEPQLCNNPMTPDDARALEEALLITEAFELDYEEEPWDSFDAPSYEEMEAQEAAYLAEGMRETAEPEGRSSEEGYNETKQGVKEMTNAPERGGSGLSNEQKVALRDMGDIRGKREEPDHGRLADFAGMVDRDAVERIVARDPEFWGDDMRPLSEEDMDRGDDFPVDEFDLER